MLMETTALLTATEMIVDVDAVLSLNRELIVNNLNDLVGCDKWRTRINKLLDSRIELMKIRG